jgi:uncharacterized small protein (DUF1192 family)
MDWDEPKPRTSKAITIGEDLKALSIAELNERIVALAAEIERIKAELQAKQTHEAAAAALFKR